MGIGHRDSQLLFKKARGIYLMKNMIINIIKNALIGAVSVLAVAGVANAATVSLNPDTISVAPGDTFQVTLDFAAMPAFFAGGVVVDWSGPPAIGISLLDSDASIAAQIEAAGFDIGFAQQGQSGPNTLDISMTGFLNDPTFQNGTLLTLNFLADTESSGIAALNARFLDTFIDNLSSPINPQPDFVGTSITISAVPVPAAVWLFGSGLLGMVGVARRRSW